MKAKTTRKTFPAIASVVLVSLLGASTARATVADLEALQQLNANLTFQYGFEGSDDSTRLADNSANGYTLKRVAGTNGGDTNNIQFVPGFDASSQAYVPSSLPYGNYRIGAGLNTVSTAVPLNANLTIETVVRFSDFGSYTNDSGAASYAYVVSGRPSGKERAYFLRQMDTNRVASTMGDTFADEFNVYNPYTPDNWYYIAMTASYDGGSGFTTVEFFGANLTIGETSLSLLGTNATLFSGDWTGGSQVGIGNFLNGSQEYLQGSIDTIAMTSEKLTQGTLQSRLDALLSGTPSELVIVGIEVIGTDMLRLSWTGGDGSNDIEFSAAPDTGFAPIATDQVSPADVPVDFDSNPVGFLRVVEP